MVPPSTRLKFVNLDCSALLCACGCVTPAPGRYAADVKPVRRLKSVVKRLCVPNPVPRRRRPAPCAVSVGRRVASSNAPVSDELARVHAGGSLERPREMIGIELDIVVRARKRDSQTSVSG